MKKYFLTTALMGTFIAPAFGADKIITSANTCTVDVLGVSDNNATANTIATWDLIDYTLAPGEYLNVTETSVDKTTCPAGSYCVGGGFTVETANNSIAQCPAEYPNSAEGAGADTQCYTACTVANANIAHATAVSGNDYYGTGTDTCTATACDTGYHVNNDIELVEQTPLIPVDYETAGTGSAAVEIDGDLYNYGFPDSGLTESGTWTTKYDYGVVYGRASCQPQIKDAGMAYIQTNMSTIMSGGITVEEFRTAMLPLAGQAKTDFAVKVLQDVQSGKMSMEDMYKAIDVVFGSDYDAGYRTTDTGQYCYCQLDGFTPTGGTKEIVTSAPWVFYNDRGSTDGCASNCADYCAYGLRLDGMESRAFRAAVFGSLGTQISGICAANTINIDWNPDNNGAHIINQCTYEGSITVPSDPVKPGYTFVGWKLLENTTTE